MEWLSAIGLNHKQIRLYQYLLTTGQATASHLADSLGEQRTNIYLLLEALIAVDLVEKDESVPVALFKATNPTKLQDLMLARQKELANHSNKIKQSLPELLGLYHLHTAYDGMAYFEGLKGYDAALEEMNKTSKEVCVFGATQLEEVRPDAWEILINKLQKRALAKIPTRIIFEETRKKSKTLSVDKTPLLQKYMQVKFWGMSIFKGEVAIFDSTVVLTSYDEKLISLIIKNQAIAATFQAIFDTAWESAA